MSYRVLNLCTVALVVASVLMALALHAAVSPVLAASPAATACQEDDPCWRWPTMGNRKRGVVTMWGTPKVVTCGDFRYLHRTRNLSPGSRAGSLPGDWSCIAGK